MFPSTACSTRIKIVDRVGKRDGGDAPRDEPGAASVIRDGPLFRVTHPCHGFWSSWEEELATGSDTRLSGWSIYVRAALIALGLGFIRATIAFASPVAGILVGVGTVLVLIWTLRSLGWSSAALTALGFFLVGNIVGRVVALLIGSV